MPSFDITATIPGTLGRVAGSETYVPTTLSWDCAIGDLPFLYATTDQRPYQRAFVQQKKDQIDQSAEPGEQTLDNVFWLRSGATFTGGAGRTFFETASRTQVGLTDPLVRTQFHSSQGIDCWTDGRATLLKDVMVGGAVGTTGNDICSMTYLTHSSVVWSDSTHVYITYENVTDTSVTTVTVPTTPAGTVNLLTVGDKILMGHPLGIEISAAGAAPTSLWTQGAGTPPKSWWVKQRMITAVDNKLYSLPITGGGAAAIAGGAGSIHLYDHPLASWVWTSVTEAPGAILAAGYSGSVSAVYRFNLADDGTLTTITSAVTTAEMPVGEVIYSICVYLGTFIAIGTNRGVRIGTVNDTGQVAYGPLTVTSTTPVKCLIGQDRFIYAGCTSGMADGNSGLYRIDLGNIDSAGRAAYATDLSISTAGTISGVTTLGQTSRLAIAASSVGVYIQCSAKLVSTGWLRTAFVRYSTLEPKHFLYCKVRTPLVLSGSLAVSVVESDGDVISVITIGAGSSNAEDLNLGRSDSEGEERLALRFDLSRGSDTSTGAELDGWQLKATPALDRQQQLSFWVECMDFERDRLGLSSGGPSEAFERYTALLDLVRSGRKTRFTDYLTGESLSVIVEEASFVSLTPPGKTNGGKFGGFVNVQARTV